MNVIPACVGKSELFDSTDPRDHHQARALCRTCPAFAACLQALATARAEACVPADLYGPAGTWAGQLVGPEFRTPSVRARAEEEMFTDDELRTFHAEYAAGFRSPRTVMAERIYQRLKKRQQQERKREAA